MAYVALGNVDAKEGYRDPNGDDPEEVLYKELPGERITTVGGLDELTLAEAFACVCDPNGVWAHHSNGAPPAWVESDIPGLAFLISSQFGGIPTERPEGWGESED